LSGGACVVARPRRHQRWPLFFRIRVSGGDRRRGWRKRRRRSRARSLDGARACSCCTACSSEVFVRPPLHTHTQTHTHTHTNTHTHTHTHTHLHTTATRAGLGTWWWRPVASVLTQSMSVCRYPVHLPFHSLIIYECWTSLDAGCLVLDAGCWMLDVSCGGASPQTWCVTSHLTWSKRTSVMRTASRTRLVTPRQLSREDTHTTHTHTPHTQAPRAGDAASPSLSLSLSII
jgi:hypothetical protein